MWDQDTPFVVSVSKLWATHAHSLVVGFSISENTAGSRDYRCAFTVQHAHGVPWLLSAHRAKRLYTSRSLQCEFTTRYTLFYTLWYKPILAHVRIKALRSAPVVRATLHVCVPTAWEYDMLIVRYHAKPSVVGRCGRLFSWALPFNQSRRVSYSLCDAPHTFTSAMVQSIRTATCEPTLEKAESFLIELDQFSRSPEVGGGTR